MHSAIPITHAGLADVFDPLLERGLTGAMRTVAVALRIKSEEPGKPCAPTPSRWCASRLPACACGQASELSAHDVLKHLLVEREIRFKRPFSSSSSRSRFISLGIMPAYFFFQLEVGRLTDPCLPADIRHRRAFLTLADDERFLGVRELRCLHRLSVLLPATGITRKTLTSKEGA